MKTAEALVKIMVKEGVRDAFGIPGAGINAVYQYLADAPIKHYCMRHEEACAHAADAYYRASHRIALAICTAGPGATNFVTGLYTASIDSIPFLAVTGQANTWQLQMEPFQCVDIAKICESVAKKTYRLMDGNDLPKIMQEAFYLMRSGRPGPVLLDMPLDVQQQEIEFDIDAYEPKPIENILPSKEKIDIALDMLAQAQKPIMIVGGGVVLADSQSARSLENVGKSLKIGSGDSPFNESILINRVIYVGVAQLSSHIVSLGYGDAHIVDDYGCLSAVQFIFYLIYYDLLSFLSFY